MTCLTKTIVAICVVTASTLSSGLINTAHADDTLVCGDRLVQAGASMYDVQAVCGAPDWVQHRTEARSVRRAAYVPCRVGAGIGRCPALVDDAVEIPVDEWTYDFGTRRFVQYVTFEDGKLINVRAGNYGHKPD